MKAPDAVVADLSRYFHFGVVMRDPAPVSINEAYSTGHNGRRFLTSAGKHFKACLTEAVAKEALLVAKDIHDAVYDKGGYVSLRINLFFKRLRNGSWKPGSRTAKGELRSPYQKVDSTNYVKLLEDAVAEAMGIDDSVHLHHDIWKLEDPEDPRVEIGYSVYTWPQPSSSL